jgi:putative addiction module component (TIGR02574 family)
MVQPNTEELLKSALALPEDERRTLAAELLNTVDEPEGDEWAAAWGKELERRSARIASGESKLESWETVRDRIRADLRSR